MKKIVTHAATLLIIMAVSQATLAKTIHVKPDGSDAADGASWATACQTIAHALDMAVPGDEIWLLSGRKYREGAPLRLKNGVAVLGNFEGTETDKSQREFGDGVSTYDGIPHRASTSILSGEKTHRVFHNDYTSGDPLTETAVLDSVTVIYGYSGDHADGGGMYNSHASPTITNCDFIANEAHRDGGAIYNDNSSPALAGCEFGGLNGGNKAGNGGAIYNTASHPALSACTFRRNEATTAGGAIYNTASSPTLADSWFSYNKADGYGGGMYNTGASGSPAFAGCHFTGNKAQGGGGMYAIDSEIALAACSFTGNNADAGGAADLRNTAATIADSTFSFHTVATAPAIALSAGSDATVSNCAFEGNSGDGHAIFNWFSTATVVHCTILGNSGSAIYNGGNGMTIANTIIWPYRGESIQEETGVPAQVSYSIVKGGHAGEGNLDSDPLMHALNYEGIGLNKRPVKAGSPAVGAGATQTRLDALHGAGAVAIPPADALGRPRDPARPSTIGAVEGSAMPLTPFGRPYFDVYETKVSAKTSLNKEMKIKVSGKDKPVAVHYRAPVAKTYTIVMAYENTTDFKPDGYAMKIYGRMWTAGSGKALTLEGETLTVSGQAGDTGLACMGAKGQNIPVEFEYYNAAAPGAPWLRFTGLAATGRNNNYYAECISSSSGIVHAEHIPPLGCAARDCAAPHANQGHGLAGETLPPGVYYPQPCYDGDLATPAPAHFHGTYVTRRNVALSKKQSWIEIDNRIPKGQR